MHQILHDDQNQSFEFSQTLKQYGCAQLYGHVVFDEHTQNIHLHSGTLICCILCRSTCLISPCHEHPILSAEVLVCTALGIIAMGV